MATRGRREWQCVADWRGLSGARGEVRQARAAEAKATPMERPPRRSPTSVVALFLRTYKSIPTKTLLAMLEQSFMPNMYTCSRNSVVELLHTGVGTVEQSCNTWSEAVPNTPCDLTSNE
jgi:hypothetical protein